MVLPVAEVQKGRELGVGDHDHTSTVSAVAPGRATARHALLPPIRFRARAPRSSVDIDAHAIDEHHSAAFCTLSQSTGRPAATSSSRNRSASESARSHVRRRGATFNAPRRWE